MNVPTSFKQRAMLVDEIWHAVGDEASDIDWYVKRTILGGIYSSTEVYMLTDSSPGLLSSLSMCLEFLYTWTCLLGLCVFRTFSLGCGLYTWTFQT